MRNLAPKWGVDLYTGKYGIQYLTVCVGIDPRTMHFFDECSVVKTSGNRHYGNSPVGQLALEVQGYASNATFTVNLLHNMYEVGHVNFLPGPSNGLDLLNFFCGSITGRRHVWKSSSERWRYRHNE